MKIRPEIPGLGRVRPAANTLAFVALLVSALHAATLPAPAKNLGDLSIEELMNESVTSVSKRQQKLGDVASAITVLSNEDLRRSGATSIAEAMRLVPGMDVGSVNAREWAVSSRGFNGVFANKLLVLVDGRAVYNPFFAGVFWDLQQPLMEDVDRVEVIRGPGATIWGANAVNGVINIVSRSARDTQGGLLYASGGDVLKAAAGVRQGGTLGRNTFYRVFASGQTHRAHRLANGLPAADKWHGWHGGFRLDSYAAQDSQLTWQADLTTSEFDAGASEGYDFNSLARWSRAWSGRDRVEVQAYYDRSSMSEVVRSHPFVQTWDLAAQQTVGLGERHDMVWGAGYRLADSSVRATHSGVQIRNGDYRRELFSAFVQDEFRPVPEKLALTAGVKIEHNAYFGFKLQPSARVVFKPAPQQTVWAAVSRALRSPADLDTNNVQAMVVGPPFPGPGGAPYFPIIVGSKALRAETLIAWELGYRLQPSRRVSLELAAFRNRYRELIEVAVGTVERFVPGVPFGQAEMPFDNLLNGESYGGEVAAIFSVREWWRLSAAYSLLVLHIDGPALAIPQQGEEGSPRHQTSLRAAFDLGARATLDLGVRHTSWIAGAPAHAAADFRLGWRIADGVELSLVGKNLLDRHHPEQGPAPVTMNSEIPRSFHAKATWRY